MRGTAGGTKTITEKIHLEHGPGFPFPPASPTVMGFSKQGFGLNTPFPSGSEPRLPLLLLASTKVPGASEGDRVHLGAACDPGQRLGRPVRPAPPQASSPQQPGDQGLPGRAASPHRQPPLPAPAPLPALYLPPPPPRSRPGSSAQAHWRIPLLPRDNNQSAPGATILISPEPAACSDA